MWKSKFYGAFVLNPRVLFHEHPTHWLISTQVAGKRLYHPVKCAADAKLGALARGMAQGHNSMEAMSTPRQDMLVGALEGFLEDLPSS